MDAGEVGETEPHHGDGIKVAELRPLVRSRGLSAGKLVVRHRELPRVDHACIRAEADEFFGTQDRVGEDDPRERCRA